MDPKLKETLEAIRKGAPQTALSAKRVREALAFLGVQVQDTTGLASLGERKEDDRASGVWLQYVGSKTEVLAWLDGFTPVENWRRAHPDTFARLLSPGHYYFEGKSDLQFVHAEGPRGEVWRATIEKGWRAAPAVLLTLPSGLTVGPVMGYVRVGKPDPNVEPPRPVDGPTIALVNPRDSVQVQARAEIVTLASRALGLPTPDEERAGKVAKPRTGDNLGTCPVCGHIQKLKSAAAGRGLVLHGYQRPGHGFIVGDCPGTGYPPIEASPWGLVDFIPGFARYVIQQYEKVRAPLTEVTVTLPISEPYWSHRDGPAARTEWLAALANAGLNPKAGPPDGKLYADLRYTLADNGLDAPSARAAQHPLLKRYAIPKTWEQARDDAFNRNRGNALAQGEALIADIRRALAWTWKPTLPGGESTAEWFPQSVSLRDDAPWSVPWANVNARYTDVVRVARKRDRPFPTNLSEIPEALENQQSWELPMEAPVPVTLPKGPFPVRNVTPQVWAPRDLRQIPIGGVLVPPQGDHFLLKEDASEWFRRITPERGNFTTRDVIGPYWTYRPSSMELLKALIAWPDRTDLGTMIRLTIPVPDALRQELDAAADEMGEAAVIDAFRAAGNIPENMRRTLIAGPGFFGVEFRPLDTKLPQDTTPITEPTSAPVLPVHGDPEKEHPVSDAQMAVARRINANATFRGSAVVDPHTGEVIASARISPEDFAPEDDADAYAVPGDATIEEYADGLVRALRGMTGVKSAEAEGQEKGWIMIRVGFQGASPAPVPDPLPAVLHLTPEVTSVQVGGEEVLASRWPTTEEESPAIRAFRKTYHGKHATAQGLAAEAIGTVGTQTGLPGFPRWVGDPVKTVWDRTKLLQLAAWIDEHRGPADHVYRDALRIQAFRAAKTPPAPSSEPPEWLVDHVLVRLPDADPLVVKQILREVLAALGATLDPSAPRPLALPPVDPSDAVLMRVGPGNWTALVSLYVRAPDRRAEVAAWLDRYATTGEQAKHLLNARDSAVGTGVSNLDTIAQRAGFTPLVATPKATVPTLPAPVMMAALGVSNATSVQGVFDATMPYLHLILERLLPTPELRQAALHEYGAAMLVGFLSPRGYEPGKHLGRMWLETRQQPALPDPFGFTSDDWQKGTQYRDIGKSEGMLADALNRAAPDFAPWTVSASRSGGTGDWNAIVAPSSDRQVLGQGGGKTRTEAMRYAVGSRTLHRAVWAKRLERALRAPPGGAVEVLRDALAPGWIGTQWTGERVPTQTESAMTRRQPPTRDLAELYRNAAKAWEDHYRSTGQWDPGLERAMNRAHAAYLKAQKKETEPDEEGEEDET
jgi:hypothetical protein